MRRTSSFALLLAALTAVSCKALEPETAEPVVDRLDLGGCKRDHVIDDGEDNDHRVIVHSERGGYMYTFVDDAGSSITPTAGSQGGVFAFHVGGANGSMYGARFYGDVGPNQGDAVPLFAGYGLNLLEPKDGYDASAYDGITFFARRAPDSTGKVRLKIPDRSTDPEGGVCSECFNDFGKDLELTTEWEQYIVPFEEMEQMPYWGNPRPVGIDPTALYAVQFQVSSPGEHFDIWIDDIAFYGCPDDETKKEGEAAGSAEAEADAAEPEEAAAEPASEDEE